MQKAKAKKIVKYRWWLRNACDDRAMVKIFNHNNSGKFVLPHLLDFLHVATTFFFFSLKKYHLQFVYMAMRCIPHVSNNKLRAVGK